MFTRKKLSTKRGYKYQYGKSPVLHKIRKDPTNFHTRKKKRLSLATLSAKVPPRAKKLSILLAIVGVIIFAIYSLLFSQYFNVKTIKVSTEQLGTIQLSGNIVDDLTEYKDKNILFINKDEIITRIHETYPEIENIHITKDLPSTIIISFSEYPLIANITHIGSDSNKKLIINSIGYVVSEDLDDPNLPYIKVKSDTPLNTESAILDPANLEYILGSMTYFEEKFGMKIVEAEYQVTPREVHLRTEKYFYIWLDIQKPYENQLKKLKKALVKLDIYNEELSYIDLRITGESGEKIIYKRR